MELIKAIILGIIQGFSEFLPISSSGHLVIFAEILQFKKTGVAFEVFVHFGTLMSVVFAFHRELRDMVIAPFRVYLSGSRDEKLLEALRWDYYILIGTIPAVIIGFTLKDPIEALFSNVLLVFFMLLITGFLMWTSKFLKERDAGFSIINSLLIGIAQAFAILPGISRSGSPLFTGMALGISREKVARFSFILSIPVIFGATILKVNDLINLPPTNAEIQNLIAGTIFSFISGYVAIIWLLDVVKKGKLEWFGYYCFLLSISGMIWYFIR
jgi:undecaprenyl-diphosphatase